MRGAGFVLPFSRNLRVRLFCLENSSHNKPMAIKAARILNKIYRVFWKATWLGPNRFKRVSHHVDSVSYRNYKRNCRIKDSYVFLPGDLTPSAPSWNELWKWPSPETEMKGIPQNPQYTRFILLYCRSSENDILHIHVNQKGYILGLLELWYILVHSGKFPVQSLSHWCSGVARGSHLSTGGPCRFQLRKEIREFWLVPKFLST